MSGPPTYPREREADVVLRDGSTVRVRPVRSGDEAAIRTFLENMSPELIGFRFFGAPGGADALADGVGIAAKY